MTKTITPVKTNANTAKAKAAGDVQIAPAKVDTDAFVAAVHAAFNEHMGPQIARLEKAAEIENANGWARTDRKGVAVELYDLYALKRGMQFVCEGLASIAFGNARFRSGTTTRVTEAQARVMAYAERNPDGGPESSQLMLRLRAAEIANDQIGRPLADAGAALYEAMFGEPMPAEVIDPEAEAKQAQVAAAIDAI